jgi:hypothetical protein
MLRLDPIVNQRRSSVINLVIAAGFLILCGIILIERIWRAHPHDFFALAVPILITELLFGGLSAHGRLQKGRASGEIEPALAAKLSLELSYQTLFASLCILFLVTGIAR